jgi:hypothetical protein
MKQPNTDVGRSLHFLPYVILVAVLILGLFAGLYWRFGLYSQKDVASYRAMMAESVGEETQERSVKSQHFRKELQKDVFIERSSGVFQFRLRSKDAWFSLERMKGKTDIVETLEDVVCWLQEDFLYRFAEGALISSQDPFWPALVPAAVALKAVPQQRVVYLEANKAMYDYDGETFVADDARIWRYIVPGHELTETVDKQKVLISGDAEHVVISFGKQGFSFKAEGFKAMLLAPQGAKP